MRSAVTPPIELVIDVVLSTVAFVVALTHCQRTKRLLRRPEGAMFSAALIEMVLPVSTVLEHAEPLLPIAHGAETVPKLVALVGAGTMRTLTL